MPLASGSPTCACIGDGSTSATTSPFTDESRPGGWRSGRHGLSTSASSREVPRPDQTQPGQVMSRSLSGSGHVAVGDQLGSWDPAHAGRHFRDPGLESVVRPRDPGQRTRLFPGATTTCGAGPPHRRATRRTRPGHRRHAVRGGPEAGAGGPPCRRARRSGRVPADPGGACRAGDRPG